MNNCKCNQDFLEILSKIVDNGCEVASEIDGSISCYYCTAYLEGEEEHDIDCLYKKVRKLVLKKV